MSKQKKLISIALLLSVGIAFMVANWLIFVPMFEAFQTAGLNWVETPHASPPVPDAYGITWSNVIMSYFLSWGGFVLITLGIVYILLAFVRKPPVSTAETQAPVA